MPTPASIIQSFPKLKTTRSEPYKKFIRSMPCLICGRQSIHHHEPLNGHGMGLKGPDDEAIPLCVVHHNERHALGRDTFYNNHEIDWRDRVVWYQESYKESKWSLK